MRRKDREMPETFAWEVAGKCEWATLGMIDPSGEPYAIPISIACENQHIYFHSAQEGFKIECLQNHAQVCVSCVGDTYRLKDAFTTEFESAVLRGTAVEITEEQEKIHALRLLCQRHTPTNMDDFDNLPIVAYIGYRQTRQIVLTKSTCRQEVTILSRWQVPPVIMAGVGNYP